MDFFETKINNWQDWLAVKQDPTVFTPLVQQIYAAENEVFGSLVPQAHGRNAVFACGSTLIQLFPPEQAWSGSMSDYQTQRWGLNRAQHLGIPAPKLLHAGIEYDSRKFRYLILRPVSGESLVPTKVTNPATKQLLGSQLGKIMQQFDQPVLSFNPQRVFEAAKKPWAGFSATFEQSRRQALQSFKYGDLVAVHGALTPTNLVQAHDQLAVLDFTSAVLAPAEYELAPVVLATCQFDKDWLAGVTQQVGATKLAARTVAGLLLHPQGASLVKTALPDLDQATLTLADLTQDIQQRLAAADYK